MDKTSTLALAMLQQRKRCIYIPKIDVTWVHAFCPLRINRSSKSVVVVAWLRELSVRDCHLISAHTPEGWTLLHLRPEGSSMNLQDTYHA